jgi:trimeric autotransporter adhesin
VVGDTQQVKATGTYSDSSTQNLTSSVTWTSTKPSVATISASGLATAAATGNTTIQATSGSISGSTGVTVTASALVSIAVTPANASILKGATQQFTATGTYSDSSTQNLTNAVTWTSSSTTVATISSGGLATAMAPGNTTVQATSGSISGSTGLTVTLPVLVSIAVTPSNSSIAGGTTQQFTATGTYSDGSTQNLTSSVAWTSTNTAVATISTGGLATGVATGSTTIQATSGSITGSTGLTVTSVGRFIQWASGDSGAASSSTTYQSQNATTGDLILIFSHWDTQAVTASAPTDNRGNTYVPIGGPVNAGTTGRFQAWYAKNIAGGLPLAVTINYSAKTATISLVDIIEYSGLDTSAPLDVFASASGNSSFQNSGLSPTTTAENETIIGLFGFNSPSSPYTAGSGFTFRNYDATSMLEDMSVTTVGNYEATATSADSTIWAAIVIGFKNAAQPPLTLTLNPSSVTGGSTSVGTVTLTTPAPSGGDVVTLTSSNTALAAVPGSVTVAAGATTATFNVNTSEVAFTTAVSISATYSNLTQTANLGLAPAAMSQVASDTFNRANASTLGPNWTPLVGSNNVTLQIASNQIESAATGPNVGKEMYYGGLNWTPDQYSEVQIVAATGNGYAGPAVRMTSNDTHYACAVYKVGAGNATVGIVLDSAGTYSTLATSTTATVNAGDMIGCTVIGTSLAMTDETASTVLLTASDSTIPSGYPGVVDSAGSGPVTNYVMANWTAGTSAAPLSVQQLASDNFNRANALNLGPNWDVGPGHGPIQIVSDQIQPYPAGGPQPSKEHYVAYGTIPNDQWSEIQVVFEDTVGDVAAETG